MKLLHMVLYKLFFKPTTLLLLFLVPICGVLLFGTLVEKGQQEIAIPIAVVDEDDQVFSRAVVDHISNQERISAVTTNRDEARDMLLRHEVDTVYVIKKDFEAALKREDRRETIEVWTSPHSLTTGIVNEVIASMVVRLTSSVNAADRVLVLSSLLELPLEAGEDVVWQEIFDFSESQWEPEPLLTINYRDGSSDGATSNTTGQWLNPYLGMWTFFTLLISILVTDWVIREKGLILPRVRSTFAGIRKYLVVHLMVYVSFFMLQTLATYFILLYLNKVEPSVSLFVSMILFGCVSMTISFLLAAWSSNLVRYYIIGMMMVVGLSLLGGSFIPVHELAEGLRITSTFLPHHVVIYYDSASLFNLLVTGVVACGMLILAIKRLEGLK
ncbi:ABC transporter permease [Alkalihalophilus lindianensis]|uniref:ABC transporter permease n=1 Tax=Alkalihalophilus lindianensis TaxID=1630542 RepID=A0ABU3XB07_9BACI|nr:ABC transporter permease [Alkalihalophilus lindianensis]MDV2684483.1 ABC transporter permease [Alkalihalophilus lindianensis]